MYKGGRPQNSVLEHFLCVTGGKNKYATCKKCDQQQASNVAGMHVQSCIAQMFERFCLDS